MKLALQVLHRMYHIRTLLLHMNKWYAVISDRNILPCALLRTRLYVVSINVGHANDDLQQSIVSTVRPILSSPQDFVVHPCHKSMLQRDKQFRGVKVCRQLFLVSVLSSHGQLLRQRFAQQGAQVDACRVDGCQVDTGDPPRCSFVVPRDNPVDFKTKV